MTLPFGIDISSYQGAPDFALLNSQVDFIAIRAGISWGFTDPQFSRNWSLASKPKIAYHVLYPGESAERQMRHFLSIQPLKPTDRLALDLELDHGYSKSRITDTVLQCLNYILENTGRYPVIYSRANWINSHLYVDRLPALDWWLATYLPRLPKPLFTPERPSPPLMPNGVTRWLIHQTGERNKGSKVGVKSYYVDSDRWNGSLADMYNWFAADIPDQPDPEPEPKPLYKAKVKMIAPDRLNVRRTPNGQIVRKLYAGDIVDVYQDNAGWSRIGIGEWVMSRYIQRLPDEGLIADGLLDVELWSQQDIRWASDRMGDTYITMAQEGCLDTGVSSYLHFLGIDTDPGRYNKLLTKYGGYEPNKDGTPSNRMYWKAPDVLWKGQVERAEYQGFSYGQGWESLAQSILASGRPALAHVDFIPGGSVQQHWVLLIGNIDGVWWMYDPIDGTVSALAARYDRVYRIVGYRKIN